MSPPAPGRRRVWISWESQRRSISLADRLGATPRIIDLPFGSIPRYLVAGLMTVAVLFRYRGQVVFVQNPSMVLATLACGLKPLFRYTLVVDRHSNFLIGYPPSKSLGRRLFLLLSRFTIRRADLTIITNGPLFERVEREGGRGFVLQDPYPALPRLNGYRPNSPLEILFVSSWSDDEPIAEVIEACRSLEGEVRVFISGRVRKEYEEVVRHRPDNVVLTGFIPDEQYFDLMSRVDCVMAITTVPYLLVCGAYEGISLDKPLILGDSRELREYFTAGAVYTSGTAPDLVEKIRAMSENLDRYRREVRLFRETSSRSWETRLGGLNRAIETLSA